MKISLRWLKNYVDIDMEPQAIAEKLTIAGIEVDSLQITGSSWSNIVVGEVTDVNPHPNADRLRLATVAFESQQYTVVCGAPNISSGQKIAFAYVGAQLIDGHTGKLAILKEAKIRGVASMGMVCSEKELGISDRHEEILVLPSTAPVGASLSEYLGDVIFNLEITPNRPDCMCVIGIAREIAALTGKPLHLPEINYRETEKVIDSSVSVEIIDDISCPRYCASLITGVKQGPSPEWMQQYLASYGMRPINNIVDITNYVMLEYGQPLHAFDYHKIEGSRIIVRKAEEGERITTLDGVERLLSQDMLVIADVKKPVAIAGVMGGLDAEVTDNTTTILLESASFNRSVIRRGTKHTGLQSEASLRFDKGTGAELPLTALKRATQLLQELADGKVAEGVIDVYPGKTEPIPIPISTKEVKRLSGLIVSVEKISKVLKLLGFKCQRAGTSSELSVIAPYWRGDIGCPADLVEEVIRIIGYDKVPMTRLCSTLPKQIPSLENKFKKDLRNVFISSGFQEILTYSLTSLTKLQNISPKHELKVTPLKVLNPMSKEQEYLRTSLRPNILTALADNQKYEQSGIKLFEMGKVFLTQQCSDVVDAEVNENNESNENNGKAAIPSRRELPHEKEMLCAFLSGSKYGLSLYESRESFGYYDAKGVVDNIVSNLGLKAIFTLSEEEGLFPGRGADIFIDGDKVGVVGEVHPRVSQYFELSGVVCIIEMDMEKLWSKTKGVKRYQSIARYPDVTRDIALVLNSDINFQQVDDIICAFPLVKKTVLFDVYTGEQVTAGKKSFAVRIIYQSSEHTLTDKEVDRTEKKILHMLQEKLGATLRS